MKLIINKFKKLENITVPIPSNISGGNGTGKSTILEALSFVLTGKDLAGLEFKQIYDNRVDLHQAIADVIFIDDNGNEYQRIVKPVFTISRDGQESIKILRATECRKNGMRINDFSGEFANFHKFGYMCFFNMKEDDQRKVFIEVLKDKLPEFNIEVAVLKLKELKHLQKKEQDSIKNLREFKSLLMNVPVPDIPKELEDKNNEFLNYERKVNSEKIKEINESNTKKLNEYVKAKEEIINKISLLSNQVSEKKSELNRNKQMLDEITASTFTPKQIKDTKELEDKLIEFEEQLKKCKYYETIDQLESEHTINNPEYFKIIKEIENVEKLQYNPEDYKVTDKCPINNKYCKIAEEESQKANKIHFEKNKKDRLDALINSKNNILQKLLLENNSRYNHLKNEIYSVNEEIVKTSLDNKKIEEENEFKKQAFEFEKNIKIENISEAIIKLEKEIIQINKAINEQQWLLFNLKPPVLEQLPETTPIPDELIKAHEEYEKIKTEREKAIGINENNSRLIAEKENEINNKCESLQKIALSIVEITNKISNYYKNLSDVIRREFRGKYDIDVKLSEFVLTKDEYKDCFKIIADGKIFPYECNGAMQNNVKTQILYNLQRLAGYTGPTIIDNVEANTTEPILTYNLKALIARATNDDELKITPIFLEEQSHPVSDNKIDNKVIGKNNIDENIQPELFAI